MPCNDALIIPANHKTVIGQAEFLTLLGKKAIKKSFLYREEYT